VSGWSAGIGRRYPAHAGSRPAGPAGERTGKPAHYGGAIPTAAFLSFRLGGTDGVAIEAAKWQRALAALGFTSTTVAGSGPVDRLLPGLDIGAPAPPGRAELDAALADADIVVVENLCSLPLNPAARDLVADVLTGRPAILRHHDLPWQRPQFAGHAVPDDPRWRHVTINELSRRQLADRGIVASTVYNAFDIDTRDAATGRTDDDARLADQRRAAVRQALGVTDDDRLVLQPTRAIPRKNVGAGMQVAADLGATYWLLGPAEDGYDAELDALVASARCPVLRGEPARLPGISVVDAYRACDVVTLPSTWEGFGNPAVESAVHRRPLAVGPYPVAGELAAFGFDWFGLTDMDRLHAWLVHPDPALLDANFKVASAHFSTRHLPDTIARILPRP
jgi:glycosyltransferase involved in cell wall biosynthesis